MLLQCLTFSFTVDHISPTHFNKPQVVTYHLSLCLQISSERVLAGSTMLLYTHSPAPFMHTVRKRERRKLVSPIGRDGESRKAAALTRCSGKKSSQGCIYIWGLGYGYGGPVYGNAGSSVQSASQLLKYRRPLPASSCKSRMAEEELNVILGLHSVPPRRYKRG